MTAGLPGTGIGGLYYLVLVLLMPVREAYLTVRGRSSRSRWRVVVRHMTLGAGIVVALFTLGWMIQSVFGVLAATAFGPSIHRMVVNATTVFNRNAMVMTVSILAGVLVVAALWQLVESSLATGRVRVRARRIARLRRVRSNPEMDRRAA